MASYPNFMCRYKPLNEMLAITLENKIMDGKMKKSLDEIKEIIKKHKDELKEKYSVKEIGIFGSFVRGEAKEDSDVDILVEFEKPIGLFKFLELEEYLSNLIGREVDLVSKKALKPHIGKHILEEVVTV